MAKNDPIPKIPEMVARIARIIDPNIWDDNAYEDMEADIGQEFAAEEREDCINRARDVLRAMRAPHYTMVGPGAKAIRDGGHLPMIQVSQNVWENMIDAALEE
jgi:hypothetical protein